MLQIFTSRDKGFFDLVNYLYRHGGFFSCFYRLDRFWNRIISYRRRAEIKYFRNKSRILEEKSSNNFIREEPHTHACGAFLLCYFCCWVPGRAARGRWSVVSGPGWWVTIGQMVVPPAGGAGGGGVVDGVPLSGGVAVGFGVGGGGVVDGVPLSGVGVSGLGAGGGAGASPLGGVPLSGAFGVSGSGACGGVSSESAFGVSVAGVSDVPVFSTAGLPPKRIGTVAPL